MGSQQTQKERHIVTKSGLRLFWESLTSIFCEMEQQEKRKRRIKKEIENVIKLDLYVHTYLRL